MSKVQDNSHVAHVPTGETVFESIWHDRYQKNGETYQESLRRVANYCAKTEEESEQFYRLMAERKFFPGGRTMSNAGICDKLTLNNCFVAPQVPDDLGGIFDTVKLGALTHQRGGGIGYDFSLLRPAGTPTSNDAIASGPVSFANVFNAQTSTILQGNRRGANMGVLNIYHPDIASFVTAKSYDAGILNHFNLSVMVDDAFMRAAENREDVVLHWPVYDDCGNILTDPGKWEVTKTVNAGKLWDSIMRHAYDNGEPGIFFYDNMNKSNNLWYAEKIVCSNPCAEYLAGTVFNGDKPSSEYGGACNLGSIMLPQFVKNPFTKDAYLDSNELLQAVRTAVRFLDNIIDVNTFPSPIYQNYQQRYRTIGLGYTGLADMLVMLGFRYDSANAVHFVSCTTERIALTAYEASCDLAEEKGSFEGLIPGLFVRSGFLEKQCKEGYYCDRWQAVCDRIGETGIRNAKLISVAPTGTMSLVFGHNCSSGIEPIFSLEYMRRVKMGGQDEKDTQEVTVRDYAYNIYLEFLKHTKDELLANPPFVTAQELSVDAHINMLAVIARNVDMSVSKTINVPTDYPFELCKDIYHRCWELGVKGCTIFRPNPLRQGVLIEKHDAESDKDKDEVSEDDARSVLRRGEIVCCDDSLIGIKRKLITGCGSMHLMAWFDPVTADIMEVFVGRGSSGGCEKNLTAMTRLVSAGLRGGVPLEYILDQLESCGGCSAYIARRTAHQDTSPGSSCASAIAIALREMQKAARAEVLCAESEPDKSDAGPQPEPKGRQPLLPKCPECGAELTIEGGCNVCKSCGWSKCG